MQCLKNVLYLQFLQLYVFLFSLCLSFILSLIVIEESGRKAFMEADGIRILYTACQESIECRESESIIVLSSHIMRKCFPKNRLAVMNLRSTLVFPLPDSDFHVPETGEGQGKGTHGGCIVQKQFIFIQITT